MTEEKLFTLLVFELPTPHPSPFSARSYFHALYCLSTCLDTATWQNCYCKNRFCRESSKRNRMSVHLRCPTSALVPISTYTNSKTNIAPPAQWDSEFRNVTTITSCYRTNFLCVAHLLCFSLRQITTYHRNYANNM